MKSAFAMVPGSVQNDLGRGALARIALIRAGAEVFGENSIERATTRDIAQRAGQNISAIAYYFGGKEGLYLAVAEYIAEIIAGRTGPLIDEVERFLDTGKPAAERCLDYFARLMAATITTNSDMLGVTSVIVREQMHPTRAFAILYSGGLERLQKTGAALIGAYAGSDPQAEQTIVRFHALLGQSLAFRLARETIIRRAGWKGIGKREEALIRDAVIELSCDALRGMRTRRRARKPRVRAREPAIA
jgi:AcrR family transcriptional regulator